MSQKNKSRYCPGCKKETIWVIMNPGWDLNIGSAGTVGRKKRKRLFNNI